MRHHCVMLTGAVAALFASAPAVLAQRSNGAPTPACALLSVAEVRRITGNSAYPDHVDGDQPGEGLGGGSSCQYGGSSFAPGKSAPLISVVLIPNSKDETGGRRRQKPGEGCVHEDVRNVGDDALYEACPKGRGPVVYASRDNNGLVVQLDAKPPIDAAAKATVIAIARAAAANIK